MTAMSIVAHSHPFVVGVDTHARNHVYAILDAANGALLDTQSFPTTAAGINRAIKWVARRTDADADTLWVIEGAASYGAILAGTVAAQGFPVAEAPRMDAKKQPRRRQNRRPGCPPDGHGRAAAAGGETASSPPERGDPPGLADLVHGP